MKYRNFMERGNFF